MNVQYCINVGRTRNGRFLAVEKSPAAAEGERGVKLLAQAAGAGGMAGSALNLPGKAPRRSPAEAFPHAWCDMEDNSWAPFPQGSLGLAPRN